jgi:trypsin
MVVKLAIILTTAVFSALSASAATIDRRIVGGEAVNDGEIPFIVSILGKYGICGGALLDSTTVLTAAHCLEGTVSVRAGSLVITSPLNYSSRPSILKVPLSANLTTTQQHRTGGTQAKIASRKAHPEYSLNSADKTKPYANNDIGIIKLSTPIERNERIAYATLTADSSDPPVSSMAVVAGW